MRLFSSGWFSRLAPLVVVVALFLFAAFLYPQQLAPGAPIYTDAAVQSSSHLAHTYKGTTGDEHTVGSLSHLNALSEEAESTEKQPLSAGILTVLFLGAFFGLLFLVGGGGRRYSRYMLTLLLERRLPSLIPRFGQKPSVSLLEVFRL